jgi:CelD/BcsL family acetyltransferase involved in cellulose biosynthesis
MEVHLLSRPEEFAALGPMWTRLQCQSRQPSPFLTFGWFDAAWRWRDERAQLSLVCCMHGQNLLGVLPLVRRASTFGAGSIRTLEFLAVPDTQVCDVLTSEANRSTVASALADELVRRQREWDAITLRYLPDGAIALTDLRQALSRHGMRCQVTHATRNPWIALDSSWETYYASRSRRLKKAINLANNRLTKAGHVEVRWLQPGQGDAADVESQVDEITAISARSWKMRTGNSLDNTGPQAFLRRLSRHAHRTGCLSIWTLMLDKQPIAMEFQLIDGGCVYALRSDFDAAYEPLSPGSHLSRHMLAHLFGRGLRRYLMGPGENVYKYRWADDAEAVSTMTVYGRSLRGRLLASRELVIKPAARRIREIFGPRAPERTHDAEKSNPEDAA